MGRKIDWFGMCVFGAAILLLIALLLLLTGCTMQDAEQVARVGNLFCISCLMFIALLLGCVRLLRAPQERYGVTKNGHTEAGETGEPYTVPGWNTSVNDDEQHPTSHPAAWHHVVLPATPIEGSTQPVRVKR